MPTDDLLTGSGDRFEASLGVLEESAEKTRLYFIKSMIFYLALIVLIALNLFIIANNSKDRGFSIGVLILLGLGLAGIWISPLRGLRGGGIKLSAFFNLFHLPLQDRLEELKDAGKWSDKSAREKRAEELIEQVAAEQKETRAWPNRTLSLTVVTIIDLLIWLVWKNPVSALINQVIASAISQIIISWAPTTAIKAQAQEPPPGVPAE